MKRLIREMEALHQNMVKRGLWKEAGPAPKNVVPKGSPNGRSAPVAYTMAGRRSDTGAPGSITNTLGGYTQRMYDDIGRMTTRSEVPPSKVNLKRPTDDFAYPMPKASPLVKGYMQDPDTGRIHYNIPELHVSLPILNMPQRSGQPNDGMHYTVNNLGYITAYDSKNNNRRIGTRIPPFGLWFNNKGIMTDWNPGRPSYRAHPAQTPTIAPPLNDRGHEVPGGRSVNRHGKQIAATPEGEAFAEYDRGEGNWLAYTDVPQETFKDKNSLLARLKRMGSGFLHPKGSPQPDNSTGPEMGDIPGMELLDQDPEKIKSMNVFNDPVLKELFPNNQTSQQTTANGPALSALRTIMVPPKRTYTGPVPLNDRGHEVPGWRVVNQNGKQVAVTPEGEAFAEYDRGEGNWLAYTDVPQVSRVSPTPQPNPQVTPAPPAEEAPEQLDVDGLDTAPETGAAAPPADPATLANAFQDPKFLEYLKWGLPIGAALGLAGYAVGGSRPGTLLPWLLGGAGGGALLGGLYGHYYGGNGETPEGAEGEVQAEMPTNIATPDAPQDLPADEQAMVNFVNSIASREPSDVDPTNTHRARKTLPVNMPGNLDVHPGYAPPITNTTTHVRPGTMVKGHSENDWIPKGENTRAYRVPYNIQQTPTVSQALVTLQANTTRKVDTAAYQNAIRTVNTQLQAMQDQGIDCGAARKKLYDTSLRLYAALERGTPLSPSEWQAIWSTEPAVVR